MTTFRSINNIALANKTIFVCIGIYNSDSKSIY